jgi:putative glutamine amidotransferase
MPAIPLIGITTYRTTSEGGVSRLGVAEDYVHAIIRAGGAPLLIPTGLPDEALEVLFSRVDGILLSGGGDVLPQRYGSQPHPLVSGMDEDRDQLEIALSQAAAASGLPFLGVCRGLQVINVALGGSLYEDLGDQFPGVLQHDNYLQHGRDYLAHPVSLAQGSRLSDILGANELQVNSLHHQGIRRLAPALEATAHAPDGVIEGIELPQHPFGLAVQWHPECLQEHAPMRRLFQEFIAAAGSHMRSDQAGF